MAPMGLKVFGVFVTVVIATSVIVQAQDEAEYFLEETTYRIREGEGSLRVTVGRTGTGDGSLRIRLDPVNANPATAEDYDSSDIHMRFSGTETSDFENINIVDDSFYEGDGETFMITLSVIDGTPGTVRAGSSTAVVTILDNDSLFYIDESESDLIVREDEGVAQITIMRDGYLLNPASVYFSTDEISNADEGDDYTRINNELVSFGQNIPSQQIEVKIIDDKVMEIESEKFAVFLSNPTNGELGVPSRTEVTISNDDGVYSFTTPTVVTSEAASSVQVCVSRTSENTLQQRNVLLTTSSEGRNTATPSGDYTPLNSVTGKLVFGAGDNLECVDITLLGDSQVESSETFTVTIAEVEGELGSVTSTTVTITDDDATFAFLEDRAQVSENANSLTITVVREGYLQTTGTVRVTSATNTAFSPQDFTAVNSFESFSSSVNGISTQTVTIDIQSDREDEADEVFYLDLVSPSGGILGSSSRMTITILDDDDRPTTPPPPSNKLTDGAIAGIIAAAAGVAALLLFGLCVFLCCMMGCPFCPWCRRRQPQKQPLVAPPLFYKPYQEVHQPLQNVQPILQPIAVPVIEYGQPDINQIVSLDQFNAAY